MSTGHYNDFGNFDYHDLPSQQYSAWQYQQPQAYGSSTYDAPPNYSSMERGRSNSSGSSYLSNNSSHRSNYTNASSPLDGENFDGIEVINGGTIGSSKSINPNAKANSSAGHLWYCVHPGCTHVSKRQFDLSRHIQNRHNIGNERYDCPGKNCHRVGESGFKRKDHLTEHLRKVHMKPIPKTGSGGGKSRSSR